MSFLQQGQSKPTGTAKPTDRNTDVDDILKRSRAEMDEKRREMREVARVHAEYREWLRKTEEWSVSFEDWKAAQAAKEDSTAA